MQWNITTIIATFCSDQIHAKSSQSGTIYYYDEEADELYKGFEELTTIE